MGSFPSFDDWWWQEILNKKILKRKINYLLNPMTNYLLKAGHRRVNQYAYFYEKMSIKENTILYESRDGKSMTDSPYAMFRYMLEHPEFQHYTHIWSIEDERALEPIIARYKKYSNVRFVKRHSRAYLQALATCAYLVNNSTFPSYYLAKAGQIYVNTWHGTPLKKMGYDIPGDPSHSQNVVRNFLSSDYILSPNSHTTNVFLNSFKLAGLYNGELLEEGYPRIDWTVNGHLQEVCDRLREIGLAVDTGKQTVLYAPTWKGTDVGNVNDDVLQIHADIQTLVKKYGVQYNFLIKVHPFLFEEAGKYPDIQDYLVPDYVDTNELLAAVDVLITDYSSIFFDFLVTDKPILFYTWDLDVYNEERGQYLRHDELPGPLLFTVRELAEALENIKAIQATFQEKYQRAKQRFTGHDDGHVTERIISYIFQNKGQVKAVNNSHTKKEKILIYPGGMRNNGITSSFLNLMNNIDYERYDVTCFTAAPQSGEALNNLRKVHPNVRMLFKPGLPVYTFFEVYQDKLVHNRGKNGTLANRLFPEQAFAREHRRLFGKAQFDYVIDFSGYSLYWAKYLLPAEAKQKICFMHSDLWADSEKVVNGKRPHRVNLRGLFSVYDQFDKIVGVSKVNMEVNRKNLLKYADDEKFGYVMNSLHAERILHQPLEEEFEEETIVENFKARAILKKGRKVWNTLPFSEDAKSLTLEEEWMDKEVSISRKATDQTQVYYKCHLEHQFIGWVTADSIEWIEDKVLQEKEVNQIGKVIRPKGNQIWTKPYRVTGCEKVSGSADYRGLLVEIDREAKTQHGTYSRIAVKGTIIGWIDQRALHVYVPCTLKEGQSTIEKAQVLAKRNVLLARNEQKNREILRNLSNRTLREARIVKPVFAYIARPEKHLIWTHAYPHWKAEAIGPAKWLEGEVVTIHAVMETRAGHFYLFSKDEKKIGWLDVHVFEKITRPTKIRERKVSQLAKLTLDGKRAIWSKPYGLEGATKIVDFQKYNGKMVEVDQEVITQKGRSAHILVDGQEVGWVNRKALKVKEEFGFEVDGRYIPEPDEEKTNFVHMGRLSPEKGQDQLIQAFARYHQHNPKSALYIMGEGALKKDLQKLIEELKMENAVYLLGQVESPFALMKKCDAFILSSHYEGQPMVLLEAMTLGMNIIATDIVANRNVLENGKFGLLVENSIEGLEKGMHQVSNLQPAPFDYQYYNEIAMETFYRGLE
ncbi:CDP-glycerol:glycerophosphate glycerophosphotransferase [Lederbergia galactosidilytica]|uniref:CDP-glycerol:glycerophosphate glycerophosphotransferase n=2 Tax=Lederbergia galactosidilytica TaxID=217031 RepID=A0A177ZJA4_9BACI|nr:CDP-glycerol:glycerophosphate glycerophosphotransferase [Lederbergia galactosidilytica]